ncbi:11560_t:CDS:2 [Gigaspora rosea]|nr:11560_t:CDS:2 [Gigaspora rosea]
MEFVINDKDVSIFGLIKEDGNTKYQRERLLNREKLLREVLDKLDNFGLVKFDNKSFINISDASDFTEFKKSPFSHKSLESFIAECLNIYVKYLIAVRNKGKPANIKALDQLTFLLIIPSASRHNYANELDSIKLV